MKRKFVLACFGALALLFMCTATLSAQELVFNGDFETHKYSPMWTLTGGNANTMNAYYPTVFGKPSWCIRRMPGTPNNNGGIEQDVYLVGGVTYTFTANCAASESG